MKEKLQIWIAFHVPRWLAYWCTIRLMAYATTGKYGNQIVPELLAMDALKRWETSNEDISLPNKIAQLASTTTSVLPGRTVE